MRLRERPPVGRRIAATPRLEGLDALDPPRCVGCGCSDDDACEGGCSWVNLDPRMCDRCVGGL